MPLPQRRLCDRNHPRRRGTVHAPAGQMPAELKEGGGARRHLHRGLACRLENGPVDLSQHLPASSLTSDLRCNKAVKKNIL